MLVPIEKAGAVGVIKDTSRRGLPLGAWSDANNVRFLDGSGMPFLGHGNAYGAPLVTPLHLLAVNAGGRPMWLYVGAEKIAVAGVVDGEVSHVNLTRTKTRAALKYAPQPAFGELGQANGLMAGNSTGLLAGLLNNARSTHTPAPSFALSGLLAGLVPSNAPTTTSGRLTAGTITEDDNYSMQPNRITATLLSGIPIVNPGNEVDPPQRWNLNPGQRFQRLDNWPSGMVCKSLRAYKNYLIALNVTRNGQNFPFMVKWSSPADPGSVPATWDETDQTQDAGQYDLAESNGKIIDGLPLRDMFMVYKEDSIWRMTPSGTALIFNFQKVMGTSGALNANCIAELDGFHVVLTGSDVIVHDGQTATSILDKQARRALFQDFDVQAIDRAFVAKNPFVNEVFICYASVGSSIPNKALVWNYVDKTVSYRDLPNVHHAGFGIVDGSLGDSWESDSDPWESDLTLWNGPDFTPNTVRVLMASDDPALYLLDTSATFAGDKPDWFLERAALPVGPDERRKLVRGVRLQVSGSQGETVMVQIGGSEDAFTAPTYNPPIPHVIGQTLQCDGFFNTRYPAIRISNGTAYFARVDAYALDVVDGGAY